MYPMYKKKNNLFKIKRIKYATVSYLVIEPLVANLPNVKLINTHTHTLCEVHKTPLVIW